MSVLVDREIRRLFVRTLALCGGFALLSAGLNAGYGVRAALCALGVSSCMGALMMASMYGFFRRRYEVVERAIAQIEAMTAGRGGGYIDCDDEGQINRLFQAVNSLFAVLQAHAQNEGNARLMLRDTLSDISHQLKNPLAALGIYNGILQEQPEDGQAVRAFAARSEQELDRMGTLVQNLLKIARWDAGTVVLEKSPQCVCDLMERVRGQYAFRAEREGKALSFEGDDAVTLPCDPHWMAEAVGNLVKNALDHTARGDHIAVTWSGYASLIRIVVRDSGSGIAPEDLPHIFKRFYRSRFSQDTQGVGLGLPLAKAVIEAHSGTITVDSAPGQGTVFTIGLLIPTTL